MTEPIETRRPPLGATRYLAHKLTVTGLIRQPITLSSGQRAEWYYDCKRILLGPLAAAAAVREVARTVKAIAPWAVWVGGPTLGADFLVAGLVQAHGYMGAIVRKTPKAHGTHRLIENAPPPATRVVLVDDVITTGGSLDKAARAFMDAECSVIGAVVLVDRSQGALAALGEALGCPARALFTADENGALRAVGDD